MELSNELYISVDIEAVGPIPGVYSMVALGACVVARPHDSYYVEIAPINDDFVPEALRVSGLSLDQLRQTGTPPDLAMRSFAHWIAETSKKQVPVFVGFNAAFDWSFVNWYFHRYIGSNSFGISGIDIKSYYMGKTGCSWDDTRSSKIKEQLQPLEYDQTHNALDDAIAQAEIFSRIASIAD